MRDKMTEGKSDQSGSDRRREQAEKAGGAACTVGSICMAGSPALIIRSICERISGRSNGLLRMKEFTQHGNNSEKYVQNSLCGMHPNQSCVLRLTHGHIRAYTGARWN